MSSNFLHKLEMIIEHAEELCQKISSQPNKAQWSVNKHSTSERGKPHETSMVNSHVELEARLGIWNENERRFVPGVSRVFMERALAMFNSYDGWTNVTQWIETQDFFYVIDSVNAKVRTTVCYESGSIVKKHMVKTKMQQETLKINTRHDEHIRTFKSENECPDIRISLSLEQEIDDDKIPEMVHPTFVRIKQRKTYLYAPHGFAKPVWRFDMTMSWCGDTKSDAEKTQRNEAPIYEIECECLAPTAYRLHKHEQEKYVAKSLLLKLLDLYNPMTEPPTMPDADMLFDLLETID